MSLLILLYALGYVGFTTVVADVPQSREWTDASGTKRAIATLERVDGENLWLRRADGKVVSTTRSRLSERDRQYVAVQQPKLAGDANPQGVVEAITNAAENIRELPDRLVQSQLNRNLPPVPAAIIYVRVSKDFIENYVERDVEQRKAVLDCILGTRIVGHSDTLGKSRLLLIPNNSQLTGKVTFDGSVTSHTRGFKHPVVLHNLATSTFEAEKNIALGDLGLRVSSATAQVHTNLTTNSISTSLPRIRGRIATKIAWRRVRASHQEAEAITEDHTADEIRSDFDKRINRSVEKVRNGFWRQISEVESGSRPMRTDVRYRTKPDCVEMALIREDASEEERKLRPPAPLDDADVSLRFHRTLLTSAMEDPQLIQTLTPLLKKLWEAQANSTGNATGSKLERETKWDIGLDWVSLDISDK